MSPNTSPHVEVHMKASRLCHLSRSPRFDLVVLLTLRNSATPLHFLKSGLRSQTGFQAINSSHSLQCIDDDTGEQIQVLNLNAKPAFCTLEPNRGGYVTFTTSKTPREYELAFDVDKLVAGRKYRLSFADGVEITHWEIGTDDLMSEEPHESLSGATLPPLSTTPIPWVLLNNSPSVTFSTLDSLPQAPEVSVSLSAPETFSLSQPYTFTLTFTLSHPKPVTLLTNRSRIRIKNSDIELLDAETGARIALDDGIDDGNVDASLYQAEDFLRIGAQPSPDVPAPTHFQPARPGSYEEIRTLDARDEYRGRELRAMVVGREYVLRVLEGEWKWWSEDNVKEVLEYANAKDGLGLGETSHVKVNIEEGGGRRVVIVE